MGILSVFATKGSSPVIQNQIEDSCIVALKVRSSLKKTNSSEPLVELKKKRVSWAFDYEKLRISKKQKVKAKKQKA